MEKVFLVTGAGAGIGREVALALIKKGYSVAAVDLSKEGLSETKTLANSDKLKTYELNIANLEATLKIRDHILADFKTLTGVINVAGIIQPFVKVTELDYKDINRVIDVNLYGTINITKTFIEVLLANNEKSYLVNVSSMGGFFPVPGQTVYGATKSAVKLFTEAIYAETLHSNLSVSVVFPGAIKTNITENSGVSIGDKTSMDPEKSKYKMLLPEKAAELLLKGMFKEKLYIYVGKDAKTMKFLFKHFPKKAIHLITNNMKDLLNKQ